jgi:hypothetical protein
LTIRYDHIEPARVGPAIDAFERLGYVPFIMLDEEEEPVVRQRFAGETPIGTLDWPPVLVQGGVKIYGPRSQ